MFKVYWMNPLNEACYEDFNDLTPALNHTKYLRDIGRTFVTMVSENPESVGKPGVDEIIDGVCPDGVKYSWMKRRSQ